MRLRVLAAAAMLAAAAVLVLLARDAWHWGRALGDGDERAQLRAPSPEVWEADAALPWGLARRALGIGDDLGFRRTLARARRIAPSAGGHVPRKVSAPVETALARTVAADTDPLRASAAADYLGYFLYFEPLPVKRGVDPYGNQGQSGANDDPVAKAVGQFEAAVTLDPGNASAKRNLEALLRQQTQEPPARGQQNAGGSERVGKKGAGSRAAGHGY